ncbi:VOC family protein [Xenophilus sp.]|uniref:VOC family protein n=1 Tax=Xenophilus sp. TaxID=1873499 RepID=UPI0037DC401D
MKFGPIRQVAYVVQDIERAMAHWSHALGVGPWFYKEHIAISTFRYRGRNSAPPKVSIAFANSGDLQVELIQQRDDKPSMYQDFLRRQGEGAQHLAFWTYEYDALVSHFLSLGYVEGHAGQIGQRGRFAYFEHADLCGNVIEVSEQTGGKAEFFREIAQAAVGWNGEEPIRRVG